MNAQSITWLLNVDYSHSRTQVLKSIGKEISPIKPVLMSNKVCSKFISEGYLFYDDNEYIASKSQLYRRIYRAKMHNGTKSY